MPNDESLLRRYRKSFIAFLIFIGYAVGLFVHNLDVRQRLQANLVEAAQLDLVRRADALSYYFAERRNDLIDLANSEVMASYFNSIDLGMTADYGLAIQLQAVEDKFDRLIERKRLGFAPIYTKLLLVDEKGDQVVVAGALPEGIHDPLSGLNLPPGPDHVTLIDNGRWLRFVQPVVVKGRPRGFVVAYGAFGPLENRTNAHKVLRPEAVIVAATGAPISTDAPELFRHPTIIQALAGLGNNGSSVLTATGEDDEAPIAALKRNVDGSPLALATVITENELAAHSIPPLLLAAMALVPMVVILIAVQEMFERRRVEEAHLTARNEAERLATARSEFLANMSHEIRTPLNAILGLAQMGIRNSAGRNSEQQFIRINESGQHLLGVINDILDCAKIEAGKLQVESVPIDIGKVIDSAVTLTAQRAYAHGLDFVVRERHLPASCRGDALRLSQILVNLLGNAIKFTESGCITLDAHVDRAELCFKISDTGIGMTAEQVSRLFQPFEQADSSTTRRYGGSGLGLSISARLVEAMGGRIEVSSTPGAGSQFDVRVPLVAPEPEPTPPQGSIVLAGFVNAELQSLTADIAEHGCHVVPLRAPDRAIPADALIVMDAHVTDRGLGWHKWLREMRHAGHPFALAGHIDEIGISSLAEGLSGRLQLLERPLRVRHFIELLRNRDPAPQAPPVQQENRLVGLRVLAADDNEVNRIVLTDFLTREGARVDCVQSGAEALARLAAEGCAAYSVVITDIQMPGMDGYELTHKILAQDPDMPILGLTAHAGNEAREHCLAAGMRSHISKPVELEILITEILQHCRPAATTETTAMAPIDTPDPSTSLRGPASADPTDGLIDWAGLEAQFKGKTAFVTKLASRALSNYRTNVIRLRALAAGEGELSELSFLAHSLKGTAGSLKAQSIHELAATTDMAARVNDPACRRLASELADGLDQLIRELEARTGE